MRLDTGNLNFGGGGEGEWMGESLLDVLKRDLCEGKSCFLTLFNDSIDSKKDTREPLLFPFYLNFYTYIFLSIFGLGWILRLTIFLKSASANIFFRKVVLK
jgi:hypothetical protein